MLQKYYSFVYRNIISPIPNNINLNNMPKADFRMETIFHSEVLQM